jgi:mannose-6-phosphate isomerase-like protein (cupin superfamily)
MPFATRRLSPAPDAIAPDGSEVRVLVALAGGGLAHFRLSPDTASVAVHHRTIEEIWYVVAGRGQMWRRKDADDNAEVVDLSPGVALTIPVGTHFQFRAFGPDALDVLGVTMPPWPGEGEAVRSEGPWRPTVVPGPGLAAPDG